MTEHGEYQLFDGFDFGSFFFKSDTMETTATAAPTPTSQWAFPPRPITKTDSPIRLPSSFPTTTETANTADIATCTNTTVGERRLPSHSALVGRRGHTRSSSCSSGGSDGGPTHTGIQCAFCKRNGETREFYSTHILKDWRGMVVCPVLRAYKCPRCGASGDHAHTESHCPLYGNEPSLMATLRTQRRSCGKKAYSWKH